MRKLYLQLFAVLYFFCNGVLLSQTAPTPQTLPYTQDFSSLSSASTTYPTGLNGWRLSSSNPANYNTGGGTGDATLTVGSASSTAGAMYNYNQKIGFLSSGSGDFGLVLAITTSGVTNITVAYDAMTIRNAYNGTTNTRINEMSLQYRIGTTGSFTTLSSSAYLSNTTAQTGSGVTTPQNLAARSITLPAACDNQPVVQLRWANRDLSGGGSRPSFAIDNISVTGTGGGDVTAPTITTYNPAIGATGLSPYSNISIVFSENIVAGNGNITLHNVTNGTQQSFAIGSSAVTVSGNSITLSTSLGGNKSYYITLDAGIVTDQAGNAFAGLSNNSWSFSTGAQPTSFDFNDCISNLPGGFKQYSVSGAQIWGCTTFGQTGNGVQINGFSGGAQNNEDWLISPSFDLSDFNYPILRFASRVRFAGPSLKLLVSTNYSGTGNPNAAQWTEINGRFAEAESDVWTTSDQIDLSAFKGTNVSIAFVYTSSPALNAARWTLDDINILNSSTPAAAGLDIRGTNIDFDYVANGQTSTNRSFSLEGYNVTSPIVLTVPAGFEISLDQSAFTTSVTIDAANANTKRTIYVRFKPTAADQQYNGFVTASINETGLTNQSIALSGTSLRTLKVVNWNLEWFGSTASGLGPTNKNLQQQNVQQVLTTLNADLYALVEIVDTLRFKNVAEALPGNYGYVVNDYGSYADDVNDPDYAGAQKLGFIYNKDVIKKISTRGLLRTSSGNAFNSWASGRYPFLMQAEVTLNGATSLVDFIVIHAKANTGNTADKIESYDRRKAGADELKDSLDAMFPNSKIIILGDMNDDFDRTITTEVAPNTVSSYSSFLNDAANYHPVTLPLSLSGNSSTVSFPDMIDHVITSSELNIAYVPNSAKVFRDVLTLISSYASTTSDHLPIITKYDWRYFSKPVITLSDMGLFADQGSCSATITLPTPNVTGFNAISSITNDAPASFPVGVTKVTWTAVDQYGNTATKEQLITVSDNQKPVIKAPAAVGVVNTNGTCSAEIESLGTPEVSDNCGIASISNNAPSVFPVGTTIVVWTATDIHGNVSDTSHQTVTVIDNQPPVLLTKSATVALVNGSASITVNDLNNGSYDNCGIASMSISKNIFNCNNIGNNTIQFTVTDIHGNISSANVIVKVLGSTPTANIQIVPSETTFTGGSVNNIYLGYGAQSATLNVSANGGAPYTYNWTGSTGLNNYVSANPVFTPTAAGNYSFTVTVTNASGCTTTTSVSFCVRDIRVPGTNGKKVYLCHNNQTLELNVNAVDAHLRNHSGDKLGSCSQQGCTVTSSNSIGSFTQKISEEKANTIQVTVLPNPSSDYFTLKISGKNQTPVQLRITDASGRAMESRNQLNANSTVQVGHRLNPGTYFAEVIQGSERKVVQLIKIK